MFNVEIVNKYYMLHLVSQLRFGKRVNPNPHSACVLTAQRIDTDLD